MFRWFESLIDPFVGTPNTRPPEGLLSFYWHFVRQVWPIFLGALVVGGVAALVEVSLLAFLGWIVDLVRESKSPATFFSDNAALLIWMTIIILLVRPVVFLIHNLLIDQTINPGFTNLIRWQTHLYVLRQSLSFFQNDFAGRVASKIMQTGPALRESVVQMIDALWFMSIYVVSALVLFAASDWRLVLPLVVWVAAYSALLIYFVPRIKNLSTVSAEARSMLTGRIVDSYTNIMTLKLFAQGAREDRYAQGAISDVFDSFVAQARMITLMEMFVWALNGMLIVGAGGLALWLWSDGRVSVGDIALVVGLVIRINHMSSWIMFVVTGVFENVGIVQEGVDTIARPREVQDVRGAWPLEIPRGGIEFENVTFHYGREDDTRGRGVMDGLTLAIAPGEKVGLVGQSGAGKSTLVNLLLRFYDVESGAITIDGQDIAKVTQDSLRRQIGMVTQDTSLLHRSVFDNIAYGQPGASLAQVKDAAKRAQADVFIDDLEDQKGRRGYDAHVGERGVKLSGGQRQRIAIARVLLKNAPILVLDEATSALDSQVEAAIQDSLVNLMDGKTVIAIAHRLSTIAAMDRLIVMDQGRIVEDGPHDELIARGGLYAQFWERQSGGFIAGAPRRPSMV